MSNIHSMKIKSFLNKKIPLWIIGILLLVVAFLYIIGFRITYAPELENSWSAISAVASWAGVIASTVAIFVAIQIPQKIANNQNKIALFDKRYEFYDIIIRCVNFSHLIEAGNKTPRGIKICFLGTFTNSPMKNIMEEPIMTQELTLLMNVINTIRKGPLLFDIKYDDDLSRLVSLLASLLNDEDDSTVAEKISKYKEVTIKIENNILPRIREEVALIK